MYTPPNIYSGWQEDVISDHVACTLIYRGPNGTEHTETAVPPESIVQNSITIRENICSGRFAVGQAISRQLDLKLIGQGWPLSYSEITLTQTFTLPDREIDFPLGTYMIYAPSVRKNRTSTTLTAYDYLLKADKVITATNADKFTGSNLWDVFSFAADLCGLGLGFNASDISGYANYAELPNWDGTSLSGYDLSKAVAMGATCRDLLASAAALIGCSLKIDRVTNRLMLVRFIPTEPVYTIDKHNAIDRDINEQYAVANLVSFGKFSGVRFGSLPPGAVIDEADLSLGTNVLLPDNYAPRLPYIMQQAVSGTQTGIGGVMKLYNIDIKWFGYPGLEAGDCITTEQEWLNTQSLDFFAMENVYKPHSPCTIRSFGDVTSNIYTNALTEPGRFSRANITTTMDVIEHVTPWEEDPVEEGSTVIGLSDTSDSTLWSRGYLDARDGVTVTGETDQYNYYYTPDYIPCDPTAIYVIDRITIDATYPWASISYYDANKNHISTATHTAGNPTSSGTSYTVIFNGFYVPPSNAAFMRVSLSGSGKVLFNTYDELNICDFSAWDRTGYLDTNGNFVESPVYCASPFISVEGISRLTFHYSTDSGQSWQAYLFYDSNQTLLSYTDEYTNSFLYISVPSNAKYIRISCARVVPGDNGNILLDSSGLV